jgi:hypothetical protein
MPIVQRIIHSDNRRNPAKGLHQLFYAALLSGELLTVFDSLIIAAAALLCIWADGVL